MNRFFAPSKPPVKVERIRRRPRRVLSKLKPFCTKDHHARLRLDGVEKCPDCRYPTKEIYWCPSLEQIIQHRRNKRALVNNGRPIPRRRSSSDYAGVNFVNFRREWHTRIRVNGGRKHLGYFKTLRDALNAYNRAAKDHGLPPATARPRFIFKDAQEIRERRKKYWREVAGPRRRAAKNLT